MFYIVSIAYIDNNNDNSASLGMLVKANAPTKILDGDMFKVFGAHFNTFSIFWVIFWAILKYLIMISHTS